MRDSFKCDRCGCEAEELSQSGDKLLCSQCHGLEELRQCELDRLEFEREIITRKLNLIKRRQ